MKTYTLPNDWNPSRANRGIPEVSARWLSNYIDDLRLIDVREPDELTGPLGRIEGVENVPLNTVPNASAHWDKTTPTVVICRSGGRSGQAAMFLEQQGFTHVVSLSGGMLDWNEQHLPLA
ncbi:MAG: rhodanese-like domain-containing protein [bacterium]